MSDTAARDEVLRGILGMLDQRKFSASQPRNPHTGEWINFNAPVDSVVDRLHDAATSKHALLQVDGIRLSDGTISARDYTNVRAFQSGAASVNSSLRSGRGSSQLDEPQRQVVQTLDGIVQRSQARRDLHVMRGVASPQDLFGNVWKEHGDNTGLTWRDDAFVSTTVHVNIAEDIAKQRAGARDEVVMHVLIPKGAHAAKLNTDEYYYHGEVLVKRGSTFRIVRDQGKPASGPRVLDVEVVPEDVVMKQAQAAGLLANNPPLADVAFPEWPKVPMLAGVAPRSVEMEETFGPADWERFVDRGEPVVVLRPPRGAHVNQLPKRVRSNDEDLEMRDRVLRALGVLDEERKFNPNEPRRPGGKGGGQWTSGAGGAAKNMVKAMMQIEDDLQHDKETTISSDQLSGLLDSLRKQDAVNLAKLNVLGPGNSNLFTTHVREIPREKMPQLPTDVEGLKPFAERLGSLGVDVELVKEDPRGLVMTQNQLDSKKVAKLAGFMTAGGWQEGGVIIASSHPSSNGAVLDGHHRWAGASAVAATGQLVPPPPPHPIQIDVLRVNMPIDDLLKLADEFSGAKVGLGTEN